MVSAGSQPVLIEWNVLALIAIISFYFYRWQKGTGRRLAIEPKELRAVVPGLLLVVHPE